MSRHRNPARSRSAPQFAHAVATAVPAGPLHPADKPSVQRTVGVMAVATPRARTTSRPERANSSSVSVDDVAEIPDGSPIVADHGWRQVDSGQVRQATRSRSRSLKRVLDIVVSLTGLCVLAPLMAALALVVKLESRGPVLFVQRRVGQHGQVFNLLKFRTMRADAEVCTGPVFARPNDPRCTRIGRVMRRHSLDELPQLINVLRGEMSLVGPRPERPYFVELFGQHIVHYPERQQAKPGITGWAQVNGLRGDTSIEERLRYDLYYIEQWSVALDLKIMVRTIVEVFRGHNAC